MQTNMETKKAIVMGRTWDQVQEEVRRYSICRDLAVSPEGYLSLEDARVTSLGLYNPGALPSLVDFSPFFERDGRTLKHVDVVYRENKGIESLLRNLGVNL